ncbi:MAG: MFS transporter, partial [Acidimicrobiia bacterium]|nr:MFS transporter [Acidimicrobiia bacterium]
MSVPSRRSVLVVTLTGVAATSFPVTVLSASLPTVADDLGTTDTTAAWVITAPLLAVAILTPMAGKLGDLYGHRRMYLLGFSGAAIMHLLTALSSNIGMLIVFRTLSQAVAATTGPAALAIVMTVYQGNERNKAMGWWGAVVSGSPALGVVLGGPIVDWLGWQWLFVIQGVISLTAVAAAVPILPTTGRRREVHFDIPGALTLGAGVGATLFSLNRGPTWGWSSPAILIGLVVGPVLLALFTRVERRAIEPLLPPEIVRQTKVLLLLASQLLTQAAYMGAFVLTPFLLERLFGYGTTGISLIMIGRPLAFSAAAALSGTYAIRFRASTIVAASVTVIAAALLLTGVGASFESLGLIIAGMIGTGFGMGFGRPVMITQVAAAVTDDDLGVASG